MIRSLTKEKSKKQAPQVSIDSYLLGKELPQPPTDFTYAQCREFRKDATVSLVREVAPGPILAANWTVEGENEEWVERIKEDIDRIRNQFLLQAVRGLNDFGWMPFEKVWYKDTDGYVRLKKLKALLHDHTHILVNAHGSFEGLQQDDINKTTIPS